MSTTLKDFEVTLKEVLPLVEITLKAGRVPFLKSAPGVGKSSLAKQVAKQNDWLFLGRYVSTYDPTDFNGLPFKLAEEGRTGYLPPKQFPIEGMDELPVMPEKLARLKEHNAAIDAGTKQGKKYDLEDPEILDKIRYKGFLILLDELPSAPDSVQVAAYRFLLEREVGDEPLHSQAHVMAAGNGVEHGAIAAEFATTMKSRVVTYNIKACHKAAIEWFDANDIDSRVSTFVQLFPEVINEFEADCPYDAFSCGRTLEFLSDQVKLIDNPASYKYMPLYAGTIGPKHATNFQNFMAVYGKIPTFDEVLANPSGVALPTEPMEVLALADSIQSNMTIDNLAELMPFFDRLPSEYKLVALRRANNRDPEIRQSPEMSKLSREIAELMMG